jgi:hypothetical protein
MKEAKAITIRNGLIFINDEVIVFNNDNRPDYMAYHLEEDFESYYENLNQKLDFKKI